MILNRINRILNHKYFVGFVVISIIIAFLLYQLLDTRFKTAITVWIQHPLILIPCVLVIVAISNFNVCLAIIMLVEILAIILPIPNPFKNRVSTTEGFETEYESNNRENEENTQYYVDGIKNLITGRIKKIEDHHNNEMKKGILENKKKILEHESSKNSKKQFNTSNDDEHDTNPDKSHTKTIPKRIFNPNKEEDTNLLITKEMLLDMVNRIEYNYENTTYLRKYLKARIEEIIDTNDLLDNDL